MYVLILNPTSGRGAALQRLDVIENILLSRGQAYRVERADRPGIAREIARRVALELPEGIIAIGGDGTLFDIANGVMGSTVPLIFVSCGTGNDFVRTLKLPKDPIEALKLQLDAPISKIDVGKMNDTYFLNVSGTGFDVEVLKNTEQYKDRYSGLRAYLYGLHDAIKFYEPMKAFVSIDGSAEREMHFAILSVGNGKYIGGGMKAVPDACVNDGLFDFVVVNPVKRWMILPLIAFFIFGKHVAFKLAKVYRCKNIRIRRQTMTINLDGELLQVDKQAEYTLCPSALYVRIPSSN